MIMKRVLRALRQHWPNTHILLRGDGHFSNSELMSLISSELPISFSACPEIPY